ncbi:MAG TPA: hypothetical protein PK876_11005, partial [Elusimicrobiota bacterium]|nr:hypothetical protein [Elusimicrobiota bacterium]
ITEPRTNQTFAIILGQSKQKTSTTSSKTWSVDGSYTETNPYTTIYSYDAKGRLQTATIQGTAAPIQTEPTQTPPAEAVSYQFMDGIADLGISTDNMLELLGLEGTVWLGKPYQNKLRFSVTDAEGNTINGVIQLGQKISYADGTSSETVALTIGDDINYTRLDLTFLKNVAGMVTSVSGEGETLSDDGVGNVTRERTVTSYSREEGRFRVDQTQVVLSELISSDGFSVNFDPYIMDYSYNEAGELQSVQVQGDYAAPSGAVYPIHSTTTDAFGNVTESWSNQTFVVIAGQAKMSVNSTESLSLSIDGSTTVTQPYSTTYSYNGQGLNTQSAEYKSFVSARTVGHLNNVSDPTVRSTTTDAFGNVSLSSTLQNFDVHRQTGQAKLMSVTTVQSTTNSIDGSDTSLMAPYTMTYEYNAQGLMTGATMSGPVTTKTVDAFGNETLTTTTQTFAIIAGQAKIVAASTHSESRSIDGSDTVSDYTMTYAYVADTAANRAARKVGQLVSTLPPVSVVSQTTDAFGNVTNTNTIQEFVNIAGQAKLKSAATHSETRSVDGSDTVSDYTMTYDYVPDTQSNRAARKVGQLAAIQPTVTVLTKTTDAFGNITLTTTLQEFINVAGQAKLKTAVTHSETQSVDGSDTVSSYTMVYDYLNDSPENRAARRVGQLASTLPPVTVTSQTVDAFGNVTNTLTIQEFSNVAGQAKLMKAVTHSETLSIDGSDTVSDYTMIYDYIADTAANRAARKVGQLSSTIPPVTVTSQTVDAFGNVTNTLTIQEFSNVAGQAKLMKAVTHSETLSIDGSDTVSDYTMIYDYIADTAANRAARKVGQLSSTIPPVTVTSKTTDAFGTLTLSNTVQEFANIAGQAKLTKAVTHSETQSVDGSDTVSDYTMTYEYVADTAANRAARKVGQLVSTLPPVTVTSQTTDAFGNVTNTTTVQEFANIAGQAKLTKAVTHSETQSIDGSDTVSDYTMTYEYVADTAANRAARKVGQLVSTLPPVTVTSQTTDAFGNVTNTTTVQEFANIAGQAKLTKAVTHSETQSIDGSDTVSDYTMTYEYVADTAANRAARKVGQLVSTLPPVTVTSQTTDAFGNITDTTTVQEFANIAGQAKLIKAVTHSETASVDGSDTVSDYTMLYAYELDSPANRAARKVGQLSSTLPPVTVTSQTTDAFGNVTVSTTEQEFINIAGQAKLNKTVTTSTTTSVDGSTTVTEPYTTSYVYAEDTKANRKSRIVGHLLESAATPIHSVTTDAFGNVTNTWTEQVFTVIAGQAKLKTATTRSESFSVDGSDTITEPYTMTYTYAQDTEENRALRKVGHLIIGHLLETQASAIRSTTTDAFGNVTKTVTQQVFVIIAGQAKLKTATTSSVTTSIDGNVTVTEPYTTSYVYAEDSRANRKARIVGQLIEAIASPIHSISTDAFGNVTNTWTEQVFTVIAGQAKLKTATTRSESFSVDGSDTITEPYTMTYTYAQDTEENRALRKVGHLIIGHLLETQASAIRSTTTDAFGNVTKTVTQQVFVIIAGQAKLKTATTSSVTTSIDGTITITEPYTTSYVYAEDTKANRKTRIVGQLLETIATPIHSISTDSFGNVTNTWTDQTFQIIAGQAKLKTATTRSETLSVDGSVTITEPYVMTYSYAEDTEENRALRKVGHLIIGHLLDARSSTIHSITTDAFGNVTNTWTDQTFQVIAGQAKLKTATTRSNTVSIDGSVTVTDPYVMSYSYEEDTIANREARKVGRLIIGHMIDAQSTTIHSVTT